MIVYSMLPARRCAFLIEPSAPPPNIALLSPENNQSSAKALEPTVSRAHRILRLVAVACLARYGCAAPPASPAPPAPTHPKHQTFSTEHNATLAIQSKERSDRDHPSRLDERPNRVECTRSFARLHGHRTSVSRAGPIRIQSALRPRRTSSD